MNTSIKSKLNALSLSDIYSLMLFILYKVQNVPEYQVLSELCFLLDGANMPRLLAYYAGKTIKFPTTAERTELTSALLLYQYINIDGMSLSAAQYKLQTADSVGVSHISRITDLYLKILPIRKEYNINLEDLQKNG